MDRRNAAVDKGACYSDVSTEMLADFDAAQRLVNSELLASITTWENGKVIAAITDDAGVLAPALTSTSRLLAVLEACRRCGEGLRCAPATW